MYLMFAKLSCTPQKHVMIMWCTNPTTTCKCFSRAIYSLGYILVLHALQYLQYILKIIIIINLFSSIKTKCLPSGSLFTIFNTHHYIWFSFLSTHRMSAERSLTKWK